MSAYVVRSFRWLSLILIALGGSLLFLESIPTPGTQTTSLPDDFDSTRVRLPSFSGHPICADLVSVGEDVHCESTAQEVHAGVPA